MVAFDRRDEFDDSDSNLLTVAAEAHRLYEHEGFREDVVEALRPVLRDHLDCGAVDRAAEDVLVEWLFTDGKGGLFQLRNQIVTNREAELEEGDVVYMESARTGSDKIIPFVVDETVPEKTGVPAWRIDPDEGSYRWRDLNAGLVHFVERYEVDRSRRGEPGHKVAMELAREIRKEEDV